MNDHALAAADPDFTAIGQSGNAGEIHPGLNMTDAALWLDLNTLQPPRDTKKTRTRHRTEASVKKREIGHDCENNEGNSKPENAP